MTSHVRVLLFCCALLLAPALYALGDRVAGTPGAIVTSGGVIVASYAWAHVGSQRPDEADAPSVPEAKVAAPPAPPTPPAADVAIEPPLPS